jgi:hypothetical protein
MAAATNLFALTVAIDGQLKKQDNGSLTSYLF